MFFFLVGQVGYFLDEFVQIIAPVLKTKMLGLFHTHQTFMHLYNSFPIDVKVYRYLFRMTNNQITSRLPLSAFNAFYSFFYNFEYYIVV